MELSRFRRWRASLQGCQIQGRPWKYRPRQIRVGRSFLAHYETTQDLHGDSFAQNRVSHVHNHERLVETSALVAAREDNEEQNQKQKHVENPVNKTADYIVISSDDDDDCIAENPVETKVVKDGRFPVSQEDLNTLKPGVWLTDRIINCYIHNLCQHAEHRRTYAFSTFFMTKFISHGYEGVSRWTKKDDIFSYDLLLVPVNFQECHWSLICVDFKAKYLAFYDSMGLIGNQLLCHIRKYLQAESTKRGKSLDFRTWKSIPCICNLPQQTNSGDCGVFLCKYAECLIGQKHLNFSPHDMISSYRRHIKDTVFPFLED
eukprot:m.218782 g.218782  ORF g.218782 m.218782 type:complete len:317 (-) comp15906_c0_seq26:496-1446(-)